MDRPKQPIIPNKKKRLGECTLSECIDYYNNGLLVEAQELIEYRAYVLGLVEAAKKNNDLKTAEFVLEESKYIEERMDKLSKQLPMLKKLIEAMQRTFLRGGGL